MTGPSITATKIPEVGAPKRLRLPTFAERKLRSGLRVLAIRKPLVPRVEFRLRVPAGRVQDGTAGGGRALLLAEALLTGTESRTALQIAEEIQSLGASLQVRSLPDDLILAGGVLSENLPTLLDLLADVLTEARFPGREVAIAADRLAQAIEIRRSQAAYVAAERAQRRALQAHRYGRPQPEPARVRAMRGPALRAHAEAHLIPRGSTLVLVGDVRPDSAVDLVEERLGAWKRKAETPYAVAAGFSPDPRVLLVHRPGSVQTNIRLLLPAIDRTDADYPALLLAETVMAGYFTSRLVRNIRETRGFCYSCGSVIDVRRLSSLLHIVAPVGGEVTAPALREIRYEMLRMCSELVSADEIDAAKRYLSGQALLTLQTQQTMADAADQLLAEGCDLEYLETFAPKIHAVTAEQVLDISQRFLTPSRSVTVLVGDVPSMEKALAPTDQVEIG